MGAALQAVTRNPLADPHLLGATSGATLGAVLVVLYIGEVIGLLTLPLAAFLGALGSMLLLVLGVASRGGRLGQRPAVAGGGRGVVRAPGAGQPAAVPRRPPRRLLCVLFWMLGGLGLARWSLIWLPALCVAGGLLVLLGPCAERADGRRTDRRDLGLDARRVRLWVFICCSLLTGVLVSVSGAIGRSVSCCRTPRACRVPSTADCCRCAPCSARCSGSGCGCRRAYPDRPPSDLPIGIATAPSAGCSSFSKASPQLIRNRSSGIFR